jgi:hypothetical protein
MKRIRFFQPVSDTGSFVPGVYSTRELLLDQAAPSCLPETVVVPETTMALTVLRRRRAPATSTPCRAGGEPAWPDPMPSNF